MLCISGSKFLRIDRSYCWEVNSGPSGYNITKSENARNNVHFLLVNGNRGSIQHEYVIIYMTMHFIRCLIQCVDHNHKSCVLNTVLYLFQDFL